MENEFDVAQGNSARTGCLAEDALYKNIATSHVADLQLVGPRRAGLSAKGYSIQNPTDGAGGKHGTMRLNDFVSLQWCCYSVHLPPRHSRATTHHSL